MPPEKRERHLEIAERYINGPEDAAFLAKEYDLSRGRIYEIVRKYRREVDRTPRITAEEIRAMHERERERQRLRREEADRRRRARAKLKKAIDEGVVERPKACERCGEEPDGDGSAAVVHGHHESYDRPYDVRWLCAWCHREVKSKGVVRARRQRRRRRALLRYRRWRRSVDYPVCGDSGGWSSFHHRPCKVEVDEPGDRCRHHPREKERPIILRGGPADPTVLESAA